MTRKHEDNWLDSFGQGREVSFEEFLKDEKMRFRAQSEVAENALKTYLKGEMRRLRLCEEGKIDEQVHKMIHDGEELFINADPDECDGDINMNRTCEEYSNLLDRSMLLIIAPYEKKIPVEEDLEARKLQYRNFCDLYPGICNNKQYPDPVVVYHYKNPYEGSLEQAIHTFCQDFAPKSKKIIIIFNGHGTNSGMLFRNGEKVHNDLYIDTVKMNLRETARTIGGVEYPQALDLVLAQCYGHLHSHPLDDGKVKVISFTNDDKPYSVFTLNRKGERRISDSQHHDLNLFAKSASASENVGKDELTTEPGENFMATSENLPSLDFTVFDESGENMMAKFPTVSTVVDTTTDFEEMDTSEKG